MFCTHCGTQNPDASRFCGSCGRALTAERAPSFGSSRAQVQSVGVVPAATIRPTIVTLLSVLHGISGALVLFGALMIAAAGLFFTPADDPSTSAGAVLIVAAVAGAVGALELRCAMGLYRLEPIGRTIQVVFAWIGLLAFPIGTIVSIALLVYFNKPGIKLLFSGRDVADFTPEEAAELQSAASGSGVVYVIVAVLLIVGGIGVIGIIAAITVPGLMRARVSGNEASAIGMLRAINSAQYTHEVACRGFAASPAELISRNELAASGAISGSTIVQSGYRITVTPRAGATQIDNAPPGCGIPVSDYFVAAEPEQPGSTGVRFFATDSRGTIVTDAQAIPNPIPLGATVLP